MIRVAAFVAVFVAAGACLSVGLPLWPVFLLLAVLLLAASRRYGNAASMRVALLVGVGIVAMLLPVPEPDRWIYAMVLWTLIADHLLHYNRVSSFCCWVMPAGYLGLLAAPVGVPPEAFWLVVEVSGVAALLAAGGPIDQLVGDVRAARSRRAASLVLRRQAHREVH